jgi:hypothetical protein
VCIGLFREPTVLTTEFAGGDRAVTRAADRRGRVASRRMLPVLLLGCAGHKSCERELSEVSDSATELGDLDGSVDSFLAVATGAWALPATWSTGDSTTVELTISRASGSATFDEATAVGLVSPFAMNPVGLVCRDRVSVPVDLTVRTDDGVLDVSGTTLLVAEAVGDEGAEITVFAAIRGDGTLVEEADDPAGWVWAGFDDEGLARVQIHVDDVTLDTVVE